MVKTTKRKVIIFWKCWRHTWLRMASFSEGKNEGRGKGTFAEEIGTWAVWPGHTSFLPSPKGPLSGGIYSQDPKPWHIPNCHWPVLVSGGERLHLWPRREEVHLQGLPGLDDTALCSWQVKDPNNKAELRRTVYLDNVGLRSKITQSLKSAFIKEYSFSSPIPFKRKSCQSVVCAHTAKLQDYKYQTWGKDSCLYSPVSGRLTRRKYLHEFQQMRTSSFTMRLSL